jgi:hypothetical protein
MKYVKRGKDEKWLEAEGKTQMGGLCDVRRQSNNV